MFRLKEELEDLGIYRLPILMSPCRKKDERRTLVFLFVSSSSNDSSKSNLHTFLIKIQYFHSMVIWHQKKYQKKKRNSYNKF